MPDSRRRRVPRQSWYWRLVSLRRLRHPRREPEPAPEPTPTAVSLHALAGAANPLPRRREPAPEPTPTEPRLLESTSTLGSAAALVTLVCPKIEPVKESGQSGKAVVEFADPVFSDGTAPVKVSCSPKSGSQFRIGTTTVSCSATHAAGESFACNTTVTVTDRPKLSNGGGI